MNTTGKGKTGKECDIRVKFVNRMWEYLDVNFRKLSKANQLKVALEITRRSMPQQIEQTVTVNTLPPIVINGVPLEINIGSTEHTGSRSFGDAREAVTNPN